MWKRHPQLSSDLSPLSAPALHACPPALSPYPIPPALGTLHRPGPTESGLRRGQGFVHRAEQAKLSLAFSPISPVGFGPPPRGSRRKGLEARKGEARMINGTFLSVA